MELSDIQDYAIQARVASVLGAQEFDRVFTGVKFAALDGSLLYVYAKAPPPIWKMTSLFSSRISPAAFSSRLSTSLSFCRRFFNEAGIDQ
jgi:hypothetical protein